MWKNIFFISILVTGYNSITAYELAAGDQISEAGKSYQVVSINGNVLNLIEIGSSSRKYHSGLGVGDQVRVGDTTYKVSSVNGKNVQFVIM